MTKKLQKKEMLTAEDLMMSQLDLMVEDKHISQDVAYVLKLRNLSNVVNYLYKKLYEEN